MSRRCKSERLSKNKSDPKDDYTSYEVFKKKIRRDSYIKEEFISAHYILPDDEDFGKWAWACYTLELAVKKFILLESQKNN